MNGKNDQTIAFSKMHGLGNDFVVIDARDKVIPLTQKLIERIADRHFGVGFDQLAVVSNDDEADAFLTFYNSDGSQSSTCGNATRCIADYLIKDMGKSTLRLKTPHDILNAKRVNDEMISVNMGHPQLEWHDIPLAQSMDTLELPIEGGPTATGMGNPHCTFFVDDALAVDLVRQGALIENHPIFPQRTNVQFASVVGDNHLRMRVWERGVGVTLASGSSTCATAVAAVRRGLTGRKVRVDLDGGTLYIDWSDDGVWMTGPTAHVFDGVFTLEFLGKCHENAT